MSSAPLYKRKHKSKPMRDGDVDAAHTVTFQTIEERSRAGVTTKKKVKVALTAAAVPSRRLDDSQGDEAPWLQEDIQESMGPNDEQGRNAGAARPGRSNKKGQNDYLRQFIDRVGDLLGGLLSREALTPASAKCTHCGTDRWAAWRCRDCILGSPTCRQCMRNTHRDDPLHRIERWTGEFFRSAALWEVGAFLLVRHHSGNALCDSLLERLQLLEAVEKLKDDAEQSLIEELVHNQIWPTKRGVRSGTSGPASHGAQNAQENRPSSAFGRTAEGHGGDTGLNEEDDEDQDLDDDDFIGHADTDVTDLPAYITLPMNNSPECAGTAGIPGTSANQTAGAPPRTDALHNSYVRVVHTNGLHHLAMLTCRCHGPSSLPLDLVASKLLPASFVNIRTLFSTPLLDYFRLCNLELKASAYQFYTLLRRLTNPLAPADVVDLYNEFRRMARFWRWMKKLKWAGYGHNGKDPMNVEPGGLANFCPACPQPDVNLPHDWKEDINRQVLKSILTVFVFKIMLVADGNFKADHVRQKGSDDIWLSDGGGMAPKRSEYLEFLRHAIEKLTKAPCENTFRAIMNALLASKACDVTGVGSMACARHGCYVPTSLVDFFKGEQQKNMDFSLLQALKYIGIDTDQGCLFIYDISCQYIVHLFERIGHLLPPGLTVDAAIGLFHIHAHKDSCFFRFATSFIPGAGIVAGEILESRWSNLNAISPAARTATLAHRAEILNDHACDSNHKKTLGMRQALCKRYAVAMDMLLLAQTYHSELSIAAGADATALWETDISKVECERMNDLKKMDIYAAKTSVRQAENRPIADASHRSPLEQWMDFSLMVEEKQIDLQDRVHRLVRDPRDADRKLIETKRKALGTLLLELRRIQELAGIQQSATSSGNIPPDDPLIEEEGEEGTMGEASAPTTAPGGTNTTSPESAPVERQTLFLPSNGNVQGQWAHVELLFRKQQAHNQLNRLRDLIADKSFQYSHIMRQAPRKGVRTRSRAAIQDLNLQIYLHARIYGRCRARLGVLGADEVTLRAFQVLTRDDLKASTAVLKPNLPGSTQLKLSWIWHAATGRIGAYAGIRDVILADEAADADPATMFEFKRIHWLRGRAQFHRWREEVLLVTHEMEWTVRYFLHHSKRWESACRDTTAEDRHLEQGVSAYCERKRASYVRMALEADTSFGHCSPGYRSPLRDSN